MHALGNPLDFILPSGEVADCTQAISFLKNQKYEANIADKGYDSDSIVEYAISKGAMVIIPPKKNRIVRQKCDRNLYKERHKIECLFGFLKHYRRLFSRFDKLASRFQAFLHFVAVLQWLKLFFNRT